MSLARIGWGFAAAAVLVRIVFWRHTGRVWEDSLITLLHAENALAGLGLTHYKPDEPPVHGFTSPLGVLIPLAGEWLRAGFALDFMRLASLAAAAGSVWLAARIAAAMPQLGLTPPLAALACGYLAFEHHQVLWGMAGMETQVVVLVLLLSILCFALRRYVALGAALGLCVLARPDLALWTVIVGAFLAVDAWRERRWMPLAQTVGTALALYLPWVVFAWMYYGSPVPNTILAKSGGYDFWWRRGSGLEFWVLGSWYGARVSLLPALGPAFGGHGTGFHRLFDPGWISGAMSAAIVASLGVAVWRRQREALLLHAFFWVYLLYFLFLVPMFFGWYAVPWLAVGILLAAHGLGALVAALPRGRRAVSWGLTVAYLGVMAGVLPKTIHAERNVQRMEEHVRIAIGRYLREHSAPGATVGGEPLGFIGYHSRRAYYDYPGLASRRVVDFVRATGRKNLFAVLMHFRPDYVVLRDIELEAFSAERAWLDANYRVERRFEAPAAVRARMLLPERNIDTAFTLFRRREAP